MEFLRKEDDEVLFIYEIGLEYLVVTGYTFEYFRFYFTSLSLFYCVNLYTKMILLFFIMILNFFPGKVY